MTFAWVMYTVVLSIVLGGAAALADRALRSIGSGGRWVVWLVAMVLSLLLPTMRFLSAPGPGADLAALYGVGQAEAWGLADGGSAPAFLGQAATALDVIPREGIAAAPLPGWALAGWLISSLVLVGLITTALLGARFAAAKWRPAEALGTKIWISEETGPAVVGLAKSRIVLPEWVTELPDDLLGLVLLHEEEHRHAHDVQLLSFGLLMLCVAPWNPVLWWHYRRLQLAIEVDCDARVIRTSGMIQKFGRLLVDMGGRLGRVGGLGAMFSRPRSFLGKRIQSVATGTNGRGGRLALVGAPMAAVLLLAAWSTPAPDLNWGVRELVYPEPIPLGLRGQHLRDRWRDLARKLAESGHSGVVALTLDLDRHGLPQGVHVVESDANPAETTDAEFLALTLQFEPAREDGMIVAMDVPVWIRFDSTGTSVATPGRVENNSVDGAYAYMDEILKEITWKRLRSMRGMGLATSKTTDSPLQVDANRMLSEQRALLTAAPKSEPQDSISSYWFIGPRVGTRSASDGWSYQFVRGAYHPQRRNSFDAADSDVVLKGWERLERAPEGSRESYPSSSSSARLVLGGSRSEGK